ncbi:hypothetical protein [Dokdonella sp.]|uniref:hypothetical protein n=1 Tax=Dokdonella sp. TaxID=2291710 RepID=UPI0025B87F69|nr:hypothetical protein [Dokdonella sp.]MBX3690658.1 hypothetical protein [Dokdonella sp.]MCW5567552.1 hypothetical protein [Dokdonella sp.]
MSGLDLAQAPPPERPLRWLSSVPIWGMAAGGWLLVHGETALTSRWSLHTVALVHLFTLGVLGNAMLGALLQFVPVAAGSAMPVSKQAGWLHVVYNLGLVLFVVGLGLGFPAVLGMAAALLALPLLAFALAALPGLFAAGARRSLRAGIGFALAALIATVLVGLLAVAILRGDAALPLEHIADVHAVLGLLGWNLALIAAVGSITLPMFQGTVTVPAHWLSRWLLLTGICLLAGILLRLGNGSPTGLVVAAAVPALLLVAASFWLPLRALHQRNPALRAFWRFGTLAVGTACCLALLQTAQVLPASTAMLAGALGIGVGLPMMVIGMLLEITAFLTWIGLRQACPRGVRVPGTGRLLPESDKRVVLAAHLTCLLALPAAVPWPVLAKPAGMLLASAHALTLIYMLRCRQRARRFLQASA